MWSIKTSISSRVFGGCFTLLFLVAGCFIHSAFAVEMVFEDFSSTAQLTLNGSVTTPTTSDGVVLRLTPSLLTWKWGSVFSTQQLNASNFSTFFTFRMTEPGGSSDGTASGADGLVFVVQSVSSSSGSSGAGIGYQNIPKSVGIEFDTYRNSWDPDSNHVGIDTNGIMTSLQTQAVTPDFYNGDLWYVWIDYNGTTLEVRLSQAAIRPAQALLAHTLDIPAILQTNTAYVGFTSGTGQAYGNHDIVSWQYRDEYDPISIEADFMADELTGVAPLSVQFTDQSSGSPTSWLWDFENDGTIDSTEQNPSWTYNQPGSYTVSLTVSDGTNGDTETKTDYIIVTSPMQEYSESDTRVFGNGDVIEIQNQSVEKVLPVRGAAFNLVHKSYWAAGRTDILYTIMPEFGNWHPDVYHQYDQNSGIIYFGYGGSRQVGVHADGLIVSEDGRFAYQFDSAGRHLRTLNTTYNSVVYEFSHDANGHLQTITDADGEVTTITRSATTLTITAPDNKVTTVVLDSNGYVTHITTAPGESYSFAYDGNGLLQQITDPVGAISRFQYDSAGRLTRYTDPEDGVLTLTRTELPHGFRVMTTSAAGRHASYQIETFANGDEQRINTSEEGLTVQRMENDSQETITYSAGATLANQKTPDPRFPDMAWYVSQSTLTSGGETSTILTNYNFDMGATPLELNGFTRTVNKNGNTSTLIFDGQTNTYSMQTPEGRSAEILVDETGRILETRLPELAAVAYAYDLRGRLTTITQGQGSEARVLTLTYDADGNLDVIANPLGQTVNLDYDSADRVIRQTYQDGNAIQLAYSKTGNLTQVIPPKGATHSFAYNRLNQEIAYHPPAIAGVDAEFQYHYNADGQLVSVFNSDQNGAITFNYHQTTGRLLSITLPDGVLSYEYDASSGKISKITTPQGDVLAYDYPTLFQINHNLSGAIDATLQQAYNHDFRIASEQVNGVTINYGYDDDGLLTQAQVLTLQYHAANSLLQSTILDAVTTAYDYNDFGEIENLQAKYQGSSLYATDFTRDKSGRISTRTENSGGTTTTYGYEYDLHGRLTKVYKNAALTYEYGYDANGNRISAKENGAAITASYDVQDRLERYGTAIYSYTQNGELLSKQEGNALTNYRYDVFGNLQAVELPDGDLITYTIDGQNRRIAKTVNGVFTQGFVYKDDLNPIAQVDAAGNLALLFVYGAQSHVPDYLVDYRNGSQTTYRIVTDHLGSVRMVVNAATGEIAQAMEYDAFGNVLNDTNPGFQPFGFAGGVYDPDTGLVRFGVRDYDPKVGRWTKKDPIKFEGRDVNLYGYIGNDSVNFIDPSGKFVCGGICEGIIGGAIGGIIAGIILDEYKRWRDEPEETKLPPAESLCEFSRRKGYMLPPSCPPVPVFKPPFVIPPVPVPKPVPCYGVGCGNAGGGGGWWGDPHLTTVDGLKYDFQGNGEYNSLIASDNPADMTIQTRQEPWGNSTRVTVNTAVAMSVVGDKVGIYLGQNPPLYINGAAVRMPALPSAFTLPNGGKIYFGNSKTITVVWPDTRQAKIVLGNSFIDVHVSLPDTWQGKIQGLLGNFDGNQSNDLATRDGVALDPATMTRVQLYHEFGESWRISQAESLFTYAEGESTETYTDRSFPAEIFMADDLTAEQRNQAQAVCQDAGITDPILLEACILDVGLTGDDTFADGYAEVTPPTQDVPVLNNYLITAAATLGGTISPSDRVVVDEQGSLTFHFTPANQYAFLEDVLVDGVSVGNASNSYAFNAVDADHAITAVFGSTLCNQVTTIPQTECQALVAVSKSMNARQWTNNTGWLQNTTPCGWNGVVCANGHVTGLLLSGNNLQGSLSPEIAALSKLTHLNLANNQLQGNLLPEIGALRELLFLQLSSNQFTGIIPTSWGQLTKLTYLSLHSNFLTGTIPREVGQMAALTQLNVFNTGLSGSVPMEVGNLVNLQSLFFHWTNLEGNLPFSLMNLTQLQSLYFNQTNLCAPQDQAFQNWLAGIPTVVSTGLLCPFFAEINVRQNTADILSGTGSYNFGVVNVGSSSAALTFTIENTGTANLTLSGITKGGSHPNDFTVTQPLSSTVTPGGSTTFTVKFVPTATGTRTATISIANNDDDENPYIFTVTGIGQTQASNSYLLWTK